MPIVNIPVYGAVTFPDSMSTKEIQRAIEEDIFKGQMREVGVGETIARGAERGATAFIRGGADLLKRIGLDFSDTEGALETAAPTDGSLDWMNGTSLSPESQRASLADPTQKQKSDIERETEFRIMADQRPVSAIGGYIAGSVADPTNLVAVGAKTITKGALNLGLFGAATGAVEPVYEEFDDSRLLNVAVGAGVGGVLGGAVGYLGQKAAKAAASVEAPNTTPLKTREEIEAELPKLEPTESLPALLAKAPEADQKYVDSILSRYDNDEPLSYQVLEKISNEVESPQLAALFRNASVVAKSDDMDAAINTAVKQQEIAKTNAAVDSSQSLAMSTDNVAYGDKTGDYRDYLRTSAVRLAEIRPEQFKRMVDPSNPYRAQNVKVLISKNEADSEVLEQIYGALEGRFNYERQTGKTFAEINQSDIPEEVAVSALLNRKVEELLPPEVLASATKATANAIRDLHNGRELARVAKELGSDEAYAVLQAQMSNAASLLASLEGNSSNLGRALAYQKQLKQLIDANRNLPNYLGGFRC